MITVLLFIPYVIGRSVRFLLELLVRIYRRIRNINFHIPHRQNSFFDLLEIIHVWWKLTSFGKVAPAIKLLSALIVIISIEVAIVIGQGLLIGIPEANALVEREIQATTKIYDRHGELLYKIYRDQNRTLIPLSSIPNNMRLATLAAEDAEFYEHSGFSIRGITRSAIKNLKEGKLTGGSTITQQLVKNALLTSDKTVERKIKEVILAVRVETSFTKDQILEMYLNEVSYGNLAYGVEEAAQVYFGVPVQDLSLAQSALIAGLPQSPSRYSPYGDHPERATERQRQILNQMADKGFISNEEKDQALSEKIEFVPRKVEIKAPHFVMFVRDMLIEKYGEDMVERGGLEVHTTLDLGIQTLAEEAVKQEVERTKNVHITNGASLVLDTKTGQILAMVGSKDYWDSSIDGNVNVTLRERSPGSSIKVVTYAYALSHGMSPASILADSPITLSIPGQQSYTPKNYDNNFRGNISLRSALAESRNIPAVKIAAAAGVTNIINLGRDLGITTWTDTSQYGPSITLGGGSTKLIDMAGVYASIANYGNKTSASPLLSVKDGNGKILYENPCATTCPEENIIDPRVAFSLIDILKDNAARTPAFGSHSSLVIPKHPEVAVKTGTSNDLRDNLTIGFNQSYLTAVWVGNNDNSPMTRIASGVTGAAPIWNRIMRGLLAGEESQNWVVPEGMVQLHCNGRQEWFFKELQSTRYCMRPEPSPEPSAQPPIPAQSNPNRRTRTQTFNQTWQQFFQNR